MIPPLRERPEDILFLFEKFSVLDRDGVVLSRCFAAADEPLAALAMYDRVRLERVSHLQAESNLGAERLQGIDPYVLRDQPPRNEDSLGIFRYDPVTVPLVA